MDSQSYNFFSKDPRPAVCNNDWCVLFTILTSILALVFACIEIEIEGPCGWADKLPTPNIGNNKKSLTIYHCLIFCLMFLVFSSVFFMNPRKFNIANLAYIFAYTLIFFTLEDFYWFVLNPYYTLDGTNLKTGKKAWWHYKIGSVPVLYITLPLIALSLCMYAGYTKVFLRSLVIFGIFTLLIILIAPLYKKLYLAKHPNNKNIKCRKQ